MLVDKKGYYVINSLDILKNLTVAKAKSLGKFKNGCSIVVLYDYVN